jgi:hypothetical protein
MSENASRLSPEKALFRLADTDASWIRVHTCPTPRCACRTALVLATHDGREILEARGASIWQAWMSKDGRYRELAHEVTRTCADLIVFDLDIDTAQALQPHSDEPLDLAQHSEVAALVAHIDGEVLDAIGHLWYRGKGLPDPEEATLGAPGKIRGWHRGEQLGWHEVYEDVRQDLYVLDEHVYQLIAGFDGDSSVVCATSQGCMK